MKLGREVSSPKTVTRTSRLSPKMQLKGLARECAGQRYLGPFSLTELEALVGPFIVSPLGLVPKQGSSSKWRLIQDLSFPRSVRRIVSSRSQ
jgi:hypothetical protein